MNGVSILILDMETVIVGWWLVCFICILLIQVLWWCTVVYILTTHVNRHCRYKAGKHGGVNRSDNSSGISSHSLPLVCVQQ